MVFIWPSGFTTLNLLKKAYGTCLPRADWYHYGYTYPWPYWPSSAIPWVMPWASKKQEKFRTTGTCHQVRVPDIGTRYTCKDSPGSDFQRHCIFAAAVVAGAGGSNYEAGDIARGFTQSQIHTRFKYTDETTASKSSFFVLVLAFVMILSLVVAAAARSSDITSGKNTGTTIWEKLEYLCLNDFIYQCTSKYHLRHSSITWENLMCSTCHCAHTN